MYSAEWINRLEQLGWVDYDVILTDPTGELPDNRRHISFSADEDTEENRQAIVAIITDQVNQELAEATNGDTNL